MARQKFALLPLTVIASGAIAKFRLVAFTGAQCSTQGMKVLGVAVEAAASGRDVAVDTKGTALVECGANVAKGASLMTDADGRAITQTSTNHIFGDALDIGGAGDVIEVLLR